MFSLFFRNNTILSLFFFFFFIIDLYFLILAMIAQISNPTTELVIQTETQTDEVNAEIQAHLVTVETKISKCST